MVELIKELKYMKIYNEIKTNIRTYKLTAGMQLLGIRELMSYYSASYSTVMKALRELESDGLVETVQGKGIFVKESRLTQKKVDENLIGLIVTDMKIPFFNKIIQVIEAELALKGYNVIIRNTDFNSVVEKDIVSNFIERGVRGLIMVPTFDELDTDYLASVDNNSINIVYINRRKRNYDCSYVIPDDYGGTKQAVEYIVECGHRDIAYISGKPIEDHDKKYEAFQDCLKGHGLPLNKDWIIYGNHFELECGYDSMNKILSMERKPTAIVCYSDSIAAGVMKASREKGYTIPDDFSVIGYNNEDITNIIEPNITTVENPIIDICRVAIGLLTNRIENPDFDNSTVNQAVLMPTKLVLKQSVRKINQ